MILLISVVNFLRIEEKKQKIIIMLIKFIFPSLRSNTNQEVCRIHYNRSLKSLNMEWIAKAIFQITNLKRDTLFSLYYYGK